MTPEEKLHTFGLTLEEAEAIGITSLIAQETRALSPAFAEVPSLKIAYRDTRGRPTNFFRIRYLEHVPDPKKPGKAVKYAQLPRSLTGVYLPGPNYFNWQDVLLQPNRQIVITEGEGKAACACKHGIICIGLGGVNSFQSARFGIELLDPLQRFNWEGRSVVIAFDSDATEKPDIVRAQVKLATLLTSKGAKVVIAQIPPPPPHMVDVTGHDVTKWGLDDFLLHPGNGVEAWQELLQDCLPPSEAAELWAMNTDYAVVMKPPAVIDMNEGQLMEPAKFQSFHLANRFYLESQTQKNGAVILVKQPVAPRWLKWEMRRQFRKLVYEPGLQEVISVEGGKHDLNLWPGWAVEPVEPTPEQIRPWLELLDFIFVSEPSMRHWFEQWLAWPLQNPRDPKLFSYCVLWSPITGIGKTTIPYIMMDIYGRKGKWGTGNSAEVKTEDIAGMQRFNTWQMHKQFIYGDEITSKDTRKGSSHIRSLTTAEEITIEEKYIQAYTIRNLINYLFSSNNADAMFMDVNDRRAMIHQVLGPRQPDAWYRWLNDWRTGGGAKYVFWRLLHLDLTGFQPKFAPPDHAAKTNMARLSMNEAGEWIDDMRMDPITVLGRVGVPPAKAEGCDLYTLPQLLQFYDPHNEKRIGNQGFGKQLSMMGLQYVNRGQSMRTSMGMQRILAVRNIVRWMNALPGEIRDHFERWHGSPDQRDIE